MLQVGPLHKRPVSVGIAPVGQLFHSERNSLAPASNLVEVKLNSCDEKDFHHLHELLLRNPSKSSPAILGPAAISLTLGVHTGLARELRQLQPLLFKESLETRKLGFPPVVMPGDLRNDLYLTLDRGNFEKEKLSTARNIEVKMGVYDRSGMEVVGAVVPAAGGGPQLPAVLYHSNTPCWGETFRLEVPTEQFQAEGCHLRLEFRHCSIKDKQERKLFAFSWLELMRPDHTVIEDGTHELPVYKCDNQDRLNPGLYLRKSDGNSEAFQRSPKESVTVQTLLCSTKLTQNVDLMSLLKWRATPHRIPEILSRIMDTGGEEIVKFLQDVLDALFSMFSTEDGNSTAHSGPVFHVLVHILSLLKDPKFEQFQPVIDAYISDHFAAALVYKGLLSCVKHCTDMVPSTDRQDPIRKCYQSLSHVFRFIVASRQLFARATGGQNEDSFRVEIHLLFNSFNKMLSYQYESVLPTQIVFLNNLALVYPSLVQVLSTMDVAKLVTLTLDSLGMEQEHGRERSKQLHKAALLAAKAAVASELWVEPASRRLLLPACLDHVRQHLQSRTEVPEAIGLILEVVRLLKAEETREEEGWGQDVVTLAEKCIGPLGIAIVVEQELTEKEEDPRPASLITALMGILELLSPNHHHQLWRADPGLLSRLFTVLSEVMAKPAFPSDWMSLRLAVAVTVSTSLQQAGNCLHYLSFDKQLWMAYFQLAVIYITSPILQFEQLKKHGNLCVGLDSVGDPRLPIAAHMVATWKSCPEQIQLVPSLVGPLLEVTLIPQREIRQTVLPLLIFMMEAEQRERGNFRQMETELIDKLDILISENKGDDEYRQIFNSLMLDLVEHLDPEWREMGTVFVLSVSRLLERLLDYRDVLQGEENRNKRMSCTVNLLKFYRDDINRQEMFIRYIYKLHDLHVQVKNHVEAAFTLQLHANQLTWSTRMLHADLQFPTQQEWRRKEQLYSQIIDLLDKSKMWEYAIPLCKELCDLYESRIYDYSKLSNILQRQAGFYQKILLEFRPEPEYYMVGFYGLSFPLFVRNKVFIYRGLDYEKISDFTTRLLKEFPGAALCTAVSPPEEELRQQESQSIQCRLVRPVREAGVYMGPEVPDKIRQFYAVNRVASFLFDRPFHRGTPDPQNEAKTLWIERSTLTCATPFPGILKWFEVVSTDVTMVTPPQFACETVQQKNTDLGRCLREFSGDRTKDLRPFTMILSGTIDAAVNGGINKYREAFFCPDFVASEPGEATVVESLAGLITELARLLEDTLDLHGELAPEPMKPLHDSLVLKFGEMKSGMQRSALISTPVGVRAARIVNTPLPPVPGQGGHKLERKDSGLSVNSNSLYGKFVPDYGEDAVYCRPSEFGNMANSYHDLKDESYHDIEYRDTTIVLAETRASTSRLPTTPLVHDYVWLSSSNPREGPPLPPRGSSCEVPLASTTVPPVLPRRPSKKSPRQSRSTLTDSGVIGSDQSSLGSPTLARRSRPTSPHSPPPLQRRSVGTQRRPPPLPPKLSACSPRTSCSPSSEPDLPD